MPAPASPLDITTTSGDHRAMGLGIIIPFDGSKQTSMGAMIDRVRNKIDKLSWRDSPEARWYQEER